MNSNTAAFLTLIRAGLFPVNGEKSMMKDSFPQYVDWDQVLQIATEQSVVGLVAAGIEPVQRWLKDKGHPVIPKVAVLQFAGVAQYIEQQNKDMNVFVAELFGQLRKAGINAVLVKGQGVAQCYEHPLWRTSGDIDLYLSIDNYEKAKRFLLPVALHIEPEDKRRLHLGMTLSDRRQGEIMPTQGRVKEWVVELHGTMHTKLSRSMNRVSDDVHDDTFLNGKVRVWDNGGVQIFLPNVNNDVIIIFNHIINHFFMEGVGLRQICDWCRLLYTHRDSLNCSLLESRIRKMRLMSEWKAFGALAVDVLGMPVKAMPFYDERFKAQGEKVLRRVLKSGNFGHNNDLSYRTRYSGMTYKIVAMWRRLLDFASLIPVFPQDAPRFFFTYLFNKVK